MASVHTHRGAKRARQCREELDLEPDAPLPCLLGIVEDRLGVPVTISDLPEGVEGQCWQLDGTRVFFVKGHEFRPRTRFTLAHELGHVRCGHDGHLPVESYYTTLGGKRTTTVETEANAFAAEFLAPAGGVRALLADVEQVGLEDVIRVAAWFGISTIAAAHRCTTLGLITPDDPLKAAIEAKEHFPLWDAYDGATYSDGLSALGPDELPRLSPILGDGALAALLRGEVSVEAVAQDLGVAPETLTHHLQRLGF